jgi:hypothetical protein
MYSRCLSDSQTQFQKYKPHLAEHIRTCSDKPSVAFSEAQKYQHEVRPDWKQIKLEKVHQSKYLLRLVVLKSCRIDGHHFVAQVYAASQPEGGVTSNWEC